MTTYTLTEWIPYEGMSILMEGSIEDITAYLKTCDTRRLYDLTLYSNDCPDVEELVKTKTVSVASS